jgi:CHAT domain-containing protein/Tfp pilus assembly protein PilF
MAFKKFWLLIITVTVCFSSLSSAQEKPLTDKTAAEKFASELAAAKTEQERSVLLATKKDLITVELQRALVKEGARLSSQGNYSEALAIFKLAQSISEQIGDRAGISNVLNGIGGIHRFQGNYGQALEYYERSLTINEELKDKKGIAETLINIGNIRRFQGNYEEALKLYRKSLAFSEELNDKLGMVTAINNIGNINYLQGDTNQALIFYQKSLSINNEMGDKRVIARVLNNIGVVFVAQGNYEQALGYYQKSLTLNEELKDKIGIARSFNNIGEIYRLQGNYGQALENYKRCLILREELKDRAGIANTSGNIGSVYYSQGDYKQALEFYQKGLKIFQELGDKDGINRMLGNIGISYSLQGDYKKAMENLQKSLTLSEELKDKGGIVTILIGIGEVYNLQGNYEKAFEFANRAADIAKLVNAQEYLWLAYTEAGVAYQSLDNLNQSRLAFEKAINVIEAIRKQIAGGEQAQQLFFEKIISPYHGMVNLLISKNKNNEALAYSERAKARVILDVLQSGRLNITKAMTPLEQEQERKINNELTSFNTQIYREKQKEQIDKSRLEILENQQQKARLELEAFQTNLYAAHPELKAQRVEVQPVTLDEGSSLLPDSRSALLEFVVTEEKTHLFVITQEIPRGRTARAANRPSTPPQLSLKVYTLDIKQKDLEKKVTRFRELLADKDLAFRKPGHELYDMLLKPAKEQLKGKTTLVIVPEGILWELPFQVLQTPQNRYLWEDHALFYTPSLTALREMARLREKKKNDSSTLPTLLALGNPALGKDIKEHIGPTLMDKGLEPLPGAEDQVRKIARLYGLKQSKYYIGADAREDRVKAEAGNYRILHFATHGILNNPSPMYSYLILSQTEEKGDEDGLLEAREIMQMDLQAEMAVLAACETARGRIGSGEGVIGLTWALFVAGCPTTVVSQWKVEDTATKDLMLEFHRILKLKYQNPRLKISKAEALRRAALKMMRTMSEPHPFYWAGFVMVGDGR